jgi:hypothetical protein
MRLFLRLAAAFVGILGVGQAVAQHGTSLAFQRAEHLRRGINLSAWYAQNRDFSPQHMDSYTTPADFQIIKGLGFDHVRLSIDPEPLIADPQLGSLKIEPMARLDRTVKQLTDAGLNVVLDIHPEESWKAQLTQGGRCRREVLRVLDDVCRTFRRAESGQGLL